MNAALHSRISHLGGVSFHLKSTIASPCSAVLVLDPALHVQARSCPAGGRDYLKVVLPATNRSGKTIQCLIKITRLTHNDAAHGIVLLMEELELPPGRPLESDHGTPSAN